MDLVTRAVSIYPGLSMGNYKTAPAASTEMPKGIPYIVTNEAAERFSFYGMKGILVVFMTKFMLDASGNPDFLGEEEARQWYHTFTSAVYFFPLIGALIADAFLGKYRTILLLSVVYCFGHFALAMDETRMGLMLGLTLIAIGSGGIKPCVSAHVGDQFGRSNKHLLEKVFGWFYFSINLGAFASTLLTPWLLNHPDFGPQYAFGIPGVLMALATVFFWMGRKVFVHIPPGGMAFLKETFSAKGIGSIAKLFIIYAFVAMFWALFDQTGSAWVQQADKMDRNFLGFEWLPSQIQAINPIMIMIFIPIFNGVKAFRWPGLYGLMGRVWPLTPLRKIGIGFFLTVPAFLLPAWIETQIAAGVSINIAWQLGAYVIMTAAEVFVSITCLEFSYTQAPKKMKSLVMAFFLLSVSLGNVFVSAVNFFIQNADGTSKLAGPDYYLFFAACMLVTSVIFIPVALWYKEKTYIQDESDAVSA
jgi:POT family proton-dependent oligopeptide transporter